jgi:RNA polymerase-binding transcription factor DksA
MALDTPKYKRMLEEELAQLTKDLEGVGFRNPSNPEDWVPKQDDLNVAESDENEVSDKFEEYEGNSAVLKQLEIRYNEVKDALERIENGTYGICETTGDEIPTERLDVNPAARTCVDH